jgi:hypothetical protein
MDTGYRPSASRGRMMMVSSDDIDESEEDLEEAQLRLFIKESIKGIVYFGLIPSTIQDIKKGWPEFYRHIEKNYGDFMSSCTAAMKKNDMNKLEEPTPYVLLPDSKMTVLLWNKKLKRPEYSQSEDLARAIERFR